jgi:hypothetical protein
MASFRTIGIGWECRNNKIGEWWGISAIDFSCLTLETSNLQLLFELALFPEAGHRGDVARSSLTGGSIKASGLGDSLPYRPAANRVCLARSA